MSSRPPVAAIPAARPNTPSRRRVITALAAAPAAASPALAPILAPTIMQTPAPLVDPAIAPCDLWLAQQREVMRLNLAWQRRESWLADHFPWFRLSPDEQRALPEAQLLYEIDDQLEALGEQSARQLLRLPRYSATSLDGVRRKLAVVAKAIFPDDYPPAHRVLTSAIRDLKAVSRH